MGQDFERKRRTNSVTKTPQGQVGAEPRVEWKGFVNYEPTAEDKKGMEHAMATGNDPADWLDKLVQEDVYDVKISFDGRNNCFRASLYCRKSGHAHAGYTLAARAGTSYAALRRVLFIHYEALNCVWNVSGESSRWSDDRW